MNILTLCVEMLVIFIMILCGAWLLRRGILSAESAKAMSYLVAHVCNPALLLTSAFAYEGKLPPAVFFRGLLVAVGFHAILIAGGYLINTLLRVKRSERYSYQLLTVFGNIGFIGIPVCRAVLGPESLVYVSVSCLVFGILFYTYGTAMIRNAAQLQHAEQGTGSTHDAAVSLENGAGAHKESAVSRILGKLRLIFNIGTLAAALSIVIYLTDPKVPQLVTETATHIGNATVFLSMLVIGCTAASESLRELFLGGKRIYVFLLLRMLVLPVAIVLLLKLFVHDTLLLGTTAVMVSLPAGSLSLMLCSEYDLTSQEISRGILLSTLLCIVTVPIVCSFL